MALNVAVRCDLFTAPFSNSNASTKKSRVLFFNQNCCYKPFNAQNWRQRLHYCAVNAQDDAGRNSSQTEEVDNLGVKAALSMLRFYKREISPLLPKSCRYVPTCSEYSMIAYKKYGVVKGSILTAWRLCRCNPFGGSGFDPPRWFDEPSPPDQ